MFVDQELASMIDHTLLKPGSTKTQIKKLCEEAVQYRFASVCVNPYWVRDVREYLEESDVRITTVVGFPLGTTTTAVKVAEARGAIDAGANEIDMVLNVGALKSGQLDDVQQDISAVVEECGDWAIVKVILETGLLLDEEKRIACRIAVDAGAAFVKTCTGFGPGQATVEDIRLMREVVGAQIGVKASGGVRDAKTARRLIEAGATRLGASAGVAIVTGGSSTGY